MGKTQFEKRKEKSVETVKAEIEAKRNDIRAEGLEEVVYNEFAYDIFSPDGGRSYRVVEIAYNPTTGQAKVSDTFDVTRLVALSFANKKQALGILKKQRKG